MTDKKIIDEERMFKCVWCKHDFKESDANFILSENPNECVCSGCMTEWADNLLWDFKRKEQECERLEGANNTLTITREKLLGDLYIVEESLKDYTEHYNRQSEKLDQLKTENERLKKELSTYGATGICETCTEKSVLKCDQLEKEKLWLQRELIQYEKDVKDLNYFAMKLKQTLTEIKEIAKEFCNTCQEFETEKKNRNCMYCNYDDILQKISEVENG